MTAPTTFSVANVKSLLSSPASFQWKDAPLSAIHWPIGSIVVYLCATLILVQLMKGRKGLKLTHPGIYKTIVATHNLFLCAWSFAMLFGTIAAVLERREHEGSVGWFFCEAGAPPAQGLLYFWSYIYYVSKYYEMLDTILVVVGGSKIPHFGLQVYHHALVVLMAWFWLEYKQSLQWGGLATNTFVHVIMYFYYAMKVLRVPTPWKRIITKVQIFQFAISFVLLVITCCHHFGIFFAQSTCSGMQALIFNAVFNASLLVQFIGVDKRNARQAEKKGQ
jgi:fatty acid elongase 3